ncbi:MAG TPA: carboxylating nicotinate-nucleotide diphosphorylase [Candidatus Aquicultor sp.]
MQSNLSFAERLDIQIERVVREALEEDLNQAGDVTSKAVIDPGTSVHVELLAKSPGVIAGLPVAARVFGYLDAEVEFMPLVYDGERVDAGTRIAEATGSAVAILAAERTALNFLQHLSGIATETARYIAEISQYEVELLDTRKTTPGLRYLEKYAAMVGGAVNHRFGLFDQILIKDNHINIAGDIGKAVCRARDAYPNLKVEVETESLAQVAAAAEADADIILLDNMDTAMLAEAVRIINGRAITEASGGITLATIKAVAATGVDRISSGAITQAAKPLDISLEVIR